MLFVLFNCVLTLYLFLIYFIQSLDSCYWPDQGERCNFGPFIVQLLALDQTQPDITIRDLQLTYDKEVSSRQAGRQGKGGAGSCRPL